MRSKNRVGKIYLGFVLFILYAPIFFLIFFSKPFTLVVEAITQLEREALQWVNYWKINWKKKRGF